jgi:hypothetical protein
VYNDRFVSSVLLCSYDLINEVNHPRPRAGSSTLWPRGDRSETASPLGACYQSTAEVHNRYINNATGFNTQLHMTLCN